MGLKTNENINVFHTDFEILKQYVYDKCNFEFTILHWHKESTEYGACSFELNRKKVQHRFSKITPTKVGQFVTIWKRNLKGITEPYHINDDIDFIIITARHDRKFGQFIFPKKVLVDKKIISANNTEGKRGIRVYPPWENGLNKQAEKTQAWQIKYFLTIDKETPIDFNFIEELFA